MAACPAAALRSGRRSKQLSLCSCPNFRAARRSLRYFHSQCTNRRCSSCKFYLVLWRQTSTSASCWNGVIGYAYPLSNRPRKKSRKKLFSPSGEYFRRCGRRTTVLPSLPSARIVPSASLRIVFVFSKSHLRFIVSLHEKSPRHLIAEGLGDPMPLKVI